MKTGKTSFAVQAPKALVCAFELGTNALAGTKYVPMMKWSDFKKILAQLRKPQARELYDTIVLDTCSVAFAQCEKYICQREMVENLRDIPWGQGWGMVKAEFQEALREITMLGFGLILLSHSKEKQSEYVDENGNSLISVEPDLPKNCYQICNAIVDIIGYIKVDFNKTTGKSERYLYTRQTPTVFAGSRWKYLDEKIPFGYNELVDAIGRAIDMQVELDGAEVGESTNIASQTKARPFTEVMAEARAVWVKLAEKAQAMENPEESSALLARMNAAIKRIFGKDMKLSQATESQQDLVELVIDELKGLN